MSRWRTLRFDFAAMASPCSFLVDGCDERAMRRAAAKAIAEVHRIESKFSRYRPGSIVGRINAAAAGKPVAVDHETHALLDFADQLWTLSDGLFDITSGVLRQVWDFRRGTLPEPGAVAQCLRLVGWKKVERAGRTVRLGQAGMELDFGGFGKEYAADRAAATLQANGVEHALINLGGDVHVLGARGLPEMAGLPWQIEIQHPRQDGALARFALARGGLATSGDYERFFIRDGKRYCHVLDPRTGWPIDHWQSVSVLAANATSAGALTTIAMLKAADGLQWLQNQQASFLAVRHDGFVTQTAQPQVPVDRLPASSRIVFNQECQHEASLS